MLKIKLSGRSSGVERNLAKVEVEGSNPTAPAYSFKKEIVPQHSSWLVVGELI